MRIVLAANSQGTEMGVAPGENYPERVRRLLAGTHEVELVLESGWTIREFNAHVDRLLASSPDVVVLQAGIVECARRILSEREKRMLARVPGSSRLTKLLHDHRPAVIRLRQRLRLDTRVCGVEEFERELAGLRDALAAGGAALLPLEIPQFAPEYAARHFPLVNEDIDLFNSVLRRFGAVEWLRPEDDLAAAWQPGTVHLTPEGHRRAAARLVAALGAPVARAEEAHA